MLMNVPLPLQSSPGSDEDEAVVNEAGIGDDYTYYSPAHSDYLIHWTGHDIDADNDAEWYTGHMSTTDSTVTDLYMGRLKSILKHGLWMTDDDETVTMKDTSYARPSHCRTCFTELKLSMIRGHSRRYGRLGIGFKRFFLLNRFGRPMVYYHDSRKDWFEPNMWHSPSDSYDEFFACFLKQMSEKTPDTTMQYTFYDESEWRIIYSSEIAERLKARGHSDVLQHFVPRHKFSAELEQKIVELPAHLQPKATIPVKDKWFAMIIYPSIVAKVASEGDPELRRLIGDLKLATSLPSSYEKRNPAGLAPHSKPIEIDLDACRHF